MAHDKCIGTWENSRLAGVLEGIGKFEIFSHAGPDIRGRHLGRNNSPLVGKCMGTIMKFGLIDTNSGEVICYINGRITSSGGKDFINGKFRKPLDEANALARAGGRKPKKKIAPDDWTAEKPGT